MTYDSYMMVCYIGLALSLLMLAVSAILFFRFEIVKVIGDVTGSNQRKGIKNIHEKKSDVKTPGKAIAGKHSLPDKSKSDIQTPRIDDSYKTTVLPNADETILLEREIRTTDGIIAQYDTDKSSENFGETVVLQSSNNFQNVFTVIDSITYINTDEQIMN